MTFILILLAIILIPISLWGLFCFAIWFLYKVDGYKNDPRGYDKGVARILFQWPFLAAYSWLRERLKL